MRTPCRLHLSCLPHLPRRPLALRRLWPRRHSLLRRPRSRAMLTSPRQPRCPPAPRSRLSVLTRRQPHPRLGKTCAAEDNPGDESGGRLQAWSRAAGCDVSSPPPLSSCCVIVAGTNNIASGQQRNIYRHLEDIIRTKLKTSSVVVSTLPQRHDLPTNHQINQEIVLVNNYIEELCARYRGAGVLDFNRIGRSAFTRHGMHL
ncbi:hypothetical protein J6590_068197 [Homalodisca vitripennis]|nr:hypothetical protein J6590_068197 [Homalodisca vitripennis]